MQVIIVALLILIVLILLGLFVPLLYGVALFFAAFGTEILIGLGAGALWVIGVIAYQAMNGDKL